MGVCEFLDISHAGIWLVHIQEQESAITDFILLTTELLDISDSGICPTQPYPESFALKSLSICMLVVENSLYIACGYENPSK